MKNELDVRGISALKDAQEFMRCWRLADGNALCAIDPASIGADPFLFGMAMVDAIRHGAKAYAHAVDVNEQHAFDRIMEGFYAEMKKPTDTPRPLSNKETH